MKCLAICVLRVRFAVIALLMVAATNLVVPGELALAQSPSASKTTRAADTAKLDVDSLKRMLKGMGYEPIENMSPAGVRSLTITEKIPSGTFSVGFYFSEDMKQLRVFSSLGIVPAGRAIPSDVSEKMLIYNNASRYMNFCYSPEKRQFRLEGVVPNGNIPPVLVRSMIKETFDVLPKTWNLWWPAYWSNETGGAKQQA